MRHGRERSGLPGVWLTVVMDGEWPSPDLKLMSERQKARSVPERERSAVRL